MKKDLAKALAEMLRKNLTSEAGSAMLEQVAKLYGTDEGEAIVVSIYKRAVDDSWVPFLKPVEEFRFATTEFDLAFQVMGNYDADEFDVSISYGNISESAMNSIRIAPYFEFMSSVSVVDNILSGSKSEYIGEA